VALMREWTDGGSYAARLGDVAGRTAGSRLPAAERLFAAGEEPVWNHQGMEAVLSNQAAADGSFSALVGGASNETSDASDG
jgi:hypothetical protein